MNKKKHVAVLMGGWNSEREVSLRSGEAVYEALIKLGYQATKIDFSRKIFEQLNAIKPDVVFNALHGQYGEDGSIQGVLDILEIPYTHSGVMASAVCMDKILTHKICNLSGIKSPQYEILKKGEAEENKRKIFAIGKPFVIKPISEGSSVGVEVILSNMPFDLEKYEWKFGDEMILEKYIAGQEIQVAIMDGKALGAIEVRPHKLFYDYECKYTAGMTDYIMPAEISSEKYAEILELAEKCNKAISCRGVSRIDFILNNKDGGDNEFYLLEVNTHPGFTATSLVPKIAKYVGISFEEIVEFLVKSARCR
jgi:D-alanine-D-alanine ligase